MKIKSLKPLDKLDDEQAAGPPSNWILKDSL